MNRDAKFWDKLARKYYKRPIADMESYEHKLAKTKEYLTPDMDVLEIGCGTGGTALIHAPFVKHIRATDISPNMIEIAKARPELGNIDNVTFECAAIDDLDIENESLDAVLALNIFHLLEAPDNTIKDIHAMLKPGGVFVSSTACIADFMKAFKWIGPVGRKLGLLPLINVFTSQEMEDFVAKAGFEIEYKWQPQGVKAHEKSLFVIAKKL